MGFAFFTLDKLNPNWAQELEERKARQQKEASGK
jgi:hypothetical protein